MSLFAAVTLGARKAASKAVRSAYSARNRRHWLQLILLLRVSHRVRTVGEEDGGEGSPLPRRKFTPLRATTADKEPRHRVQTLPDGVTGHDISLW